MKQPCNTRLLTLHHLVKPVFSLCFHRDGSACASYFIDSSGKHHEVPYYYTDIQDDGDETKFILRNFQVLRLFLLLL